MPTSADLSKNPRFVLAGVLLDLALGLEENSEKLIKAGRVGARGPITDVPYCEIGQGHGTFNREADGGLDLVIAYEPTFFVRFLDHFQGDAGHLPHVEHINQIVTKMINALEANETLSGLVEHAIVTDELYGAEDRDGRRFWFGELEVMVRFTRSHYG